MGLLQIRSPLSAILRHRNILAYEFAIQAKIPRNDLVDYCRGSKPWRPEHLQRAAETLRVPPEVLTAPLKKSDPNASAPAP